MAENKTMIFQYIRHPKTNGRRGVAVAVLCEAGIIRYGISLHNQRDKPDAKHGLQIATVRAIKARPGPIIGVDHTADMVANTMANLQERAQRYFKDAKEFQSAPTFSLTSELQAKRNKAIISHLANR